MACPDDAEIVAFAEGVLDSAQRRAIREHIEQCAECAGLVAEAARDPDTTTGVVGELEPSALVRGATVGRYLLLEPVGQGGLGLVFAAYDPELDRKVAIKLIRPEVVGSGHSEELRARLVREAQALARVRHPNVVAVHDVGVFEGHVFLAMEMVEGQTLRDWVGAEPRRWEAIRDVFVAAGAGLAAAHVAGLVHRDFKPANVLIGHDERVQVADFGLARAVESGEHEGVAPSPTRVPRSSPLNETITQSGTVLGTPAYMAPEQHLGLTVDARADQFAFCVALHEALYGQRPFAARTAVQLLDAIQRSALVPLPRKSTVPRWLHAAVVRGLRADPAERYDDMAELLTALTIDRRRRRRGFGAMAALLVALAGLGWTRALLISPDPAAIDHIQTLVDQARDAASRAHFVYPPVELPNEPTAYTKVLELERLDGSETDAARARALELRQEFASTLMRLGDEYWDRTGGSVFAADYYAAALVFVPDDPRALERARLTPVQLGVLAEKAARLGFSEGELVAAEPLSALAQVDHHARLRALAALYAGPPRPGVSTTAALETLLGQDAVWVFEPTSASMDQAIAEPEPVEHEDRSGETEPRAPQADKPDARPTQLRHRTPPKSGDPPVAPDHGGPTSAFEDPEARSAINPAAAAELARQGQVALREGHIAKAETAFHAALGHDRRSVAALAGLGEVYFQKQAYEKSIEFLERATRASPRSATHRISLGDVYFKVLRYDDALGQYEQAQALGSERASQRIERLRAKIGRGSTP